MLDGPNLVTICFALAGVIIALFIAVWYIVKLKRNITLQAEAIKSLQRMQHEKLASLDTTLNPHLFKNVLNSIQSHAYQTYFALDKLANVLDYILYDSRQQFVTPKEEIEFMLNFIEINKVKLNPLFELQVKSKIDERDQLYNQKVLAPLLTIDLIENAFKHADIQSQDAYIKVIAEFRNGIFVLTVANKISEKPPLSKPRSGLGQRTMHERLQLIYGDHATLDRSNRGDRYISELKIRLREFKNQMYTA